jgi:putative endonuclease
LAERIVVSMSRSEEGLSHFVAAAIIGTEVQAEQSCGTLGRTLGMSSPSAWFVYILRCGDASLYTGIARDVKSRIASHEAGRGARYTRGRGPFVLCVTRRCGNQGEALRLEYAIKQLSRREKEALILPRRLAAFARALAKQSRAEP